MNILYVEDDARDADLTVRMLKKRAPQLEFEVVSTLTKATSRLQRLPAEPLDLVLTDMNLPDGSGLSLLNHIRENSLPVAVVVITGSGDEETAVTALKARANDYVVKHKDYLDRLPTILESALNHYRADAVRRARPLKVLYAESALGDVELTRRHFAVHADHHHLQIVSSGLAVLAALRAPETYDVLLMDVVLPDMSGLDVLRELRLILKHDLPVVLSCSKGNEELARQGLKLGASSYVVKQPGYLFELPLQVEDAYSRAELQRRETALERSESRNRAILSAIPDLMFLMSRDGTYLDYHCKSPAALLLPPEQFIGRNISDIMPPNLATEFHKYFAGASEKPSLIEYKLSLPDGEHVFEASIVTCDDDRLLSIVRDITERKQAENALRESEERLRVAQQAARVGTWEWDVQSGASIWSDMIWTLLGLEPGEVVPTIDSFLAFIHPDDRDVMFSKVNDVLAEREVCDYHDEFPDCAAKGNVLWVSAKGRVIRAPDGTPQRMVGVTIDITERKLAMDWLKSALAEVQKLKDRLHEENIYLQEEIRVASDFSEIIGQSEALRKVLRQAEQVAPINTTVLILGETGTGKELLAHAIHNNSPRAKQRMVKVNCAALPAPLIESELFGHQKGAFTGADAHRMGRFALADGGTLFLDEVGEMPLELQAKLLRVLEEGEFELVGSSRSIKVDVRVIAATNRNLAEAVAKGTFRSDLYYRLSIFPIVMPPLRERREDIRSLVAHMVKQLSVKLGKQIESIPQSAINALENYDWPGNVRELRNVIERAVIITRGSKLELTDTFDRLDGKIEAQPVTSVERHDHELDGETLEQNEYRLILRTLKKVHWRVEGAGGAAELLNVHASTLRSRMRKLGIARPKVKPQMNADERGF